MNYTIFRDGQQYGPYTLADLQRYVASGDVLLTDLASSEGMGEPVPVSQIVGTIPVPLQAAAPSAPAIEYPNPPNLHWGLVLLFTILTWGMFMSVWGVVLSFWLKKVAPSSRALYFYIAELGCLALVFALGMASVVAHGATTLIPIVQLASFVLTLIARYSFRSSMEEHYNNVEGIPLTLSGVMTFFFSTIYFQYHVNDIVRRKRVEQLQLVTG
ncbi:DUF4339 domain-containing protein [Terriglobus albidus]|uniref:DUF4339 domain-containing protein n=1 Tax=Terriglobus albidus TaxID=1592106 RepID=A0A5B9E4U2_9BACT|nr:DUF4339 domain-containing protein [Terriglobus albidus]QEE27313.1 DUF4339 domain-containing protein [Terriglobus albidus]